jgi:Protein of unknown function (DUF4242)
MPHDGIPARLYVDIRSHDQGDDSMNKYVIERTVPGAGQMDAAALAAIAEKSNGVLRDLGPDVQWVHSYVTDDKIVCVYNAVSEDIVREHGRCGGFPVDAVYQVHAVIDPATA